jgi:hypothetical protein
VYCSTAYCCSRRTCGRWDRKAQLSQVAGFQEERCLPGRLPSATNNGCCFQPLVRPAVDLDLDSCRPYLSDIQILNQAGVGARGNQENAQTILVDGSHQVHSLPKPSLDVELSGVGVSRARLRICHSGQAVVIIQFERTGVPERAALQKFVGPSRRGLIKQRHAGRYKALAIRGVVQSSAQIQRPVTRQPPFA